MEVVVSTIDYNMPDIRNSQIQTQTQSQVQIQSLSPQQVLEAKLLELSTIELEDKVRAVLDDNPALEEGYEDIPQNDEEGFNDSSTEESHHDDFLSEDDEPDFYSDRRKSPAREAMEIPYSEPESFYDVLNNQLAERELTELQKSIAEYLIGSLNNDGFLDKSLESISDDLAFYSYLDISVDEISKVLAIIQDFEPAGIGARNLQESLLIQLDRKGNHGVEFDIIKECFEEGIQDVIAPEQIAILTVEEVVDLIMLTVAALKADNIIISESQKAKDQRRLPSSRRSSIKRRS